jgi:hypothetical protein
MKIVVTYTIGDEECCCDYTTPIEYESAEKAEFDFELILTKLLETDWRQRKGFRFGGTWFAYYYFINDNGYSMPMFEELNSWFDRRLNEEFCNKGDDEYGKKP